MADIADAPTKDFLQWVMRSIATRASMGMAYRKNWTPEFTCEEIDEIWSDKRSVLRDETKRRVSLAELRDLSKDELGALGFIPWNADLVCIPLWAWNYIADGETLTSIDGDTAVKGTDPIDLDVRAGCIAYGFRPPLPQTNP